MPIAVYRKATARVVPTRKGRAKGIPIMAVILMILGAVLVGTVAGPVAKYYVFSKLDLTGSSRWLTPLPAGEIAGENKVTASGPIVNTELDYHRPENWFPGVNFDKAKHSKITDYNISIFKLGIHDAVVTIGGNDLSESLIQYPGTANPGGLGSVVIFGHSILRQFYNPKNYTAIFSKIMTLDKGDEILINFDGVKYTYRVIDKIQVEPMDVEILEQRFDGRYLKLITCVPEGTYLARGVVVAELR